jgi:hypothetical protein
MRESQDDQLGRDVDVNFKLAVDSEKTESPKSRPGTDGIGFEHDCARLETVHDQGQQLRHNATVYLSVVSDSDSDVDN